MSHHMNLNIVPLWEMLMFDLIWFHPLNLIHTWLFVVYSNRSKLKSNHGYSMFATRPTCNLRVSRDLYMNGFDLFLHVNTFPPHSFSVESFCVIIWATLYRYFWISSMYHLNFSVPNGFQSISPFQTIALLQYLPSRSWQVTSQCLRKICQISQIYGKRKHQYLLISIISLAVCYLYVDIV